MNDQYGTRFGLQLGLSPGTAGRGARNLLESHEMNAFHEVDTRPNTHKVFQTMKEIQCNGHTHPADGKWLSQFSVKQIEAGQDKRDTYCTTGSDYGHFPRGSEPLGRPPVIHTLKTTFTHHLARSGMFKDHSMNG